MKMAMRTFCSLRMVSDYENIYYKTASEHWDQLFADSAEQAKKLAAQTKRIRSLWKKIKISPPVRLTPEPYRVGDSFQVQAEVDLAELNPEEVDVELYYGNLKSLELLSTSHVEPMKVLNSNGDGKYIYECSLKCEVSGRFGLTARVSPAGDDRIKSMPGLLTWA